MQKRNRMPIIIDADRITKMETTNRTITTLSPDYAWLVTLILFWSCVVLIASYFAVCQFVMQYAPRNNEDIELDAV